MCIVATDLNEEESSSATGACSEDNVDETRATTIDTSDTSVNDSSDCKDGSDCNDSDDSDSSDGSSDGSDGSDGSSESSENIDNSEDAAVGNKGKNAKQWYHLLKKYTLQMGGNINYLQLMLDQFGYDQNEFETNNILFGSQIVFSIGKDSRVIYKDNKCDFLINHCNAGTGSYKNDEYDVFFKHRINTKKNKSNDLLCFVSKLSLVNDDPKAFAKNMVYKLCNQHEIKERINNYNKIRIENNDDSTPISHVTTFKFMYEELACIGTQECKPSEKYVYLKFSSNVV